MYMTGHISGDFQKTETVTLPTKLNNLKCKEHRTLGLISQSSKILKIIQNRLKPITKLEQTLDVNTVLDKIEGQGQGKLFLD